MDEIGTQYKRGDLVGSIQDLESKYKGMINHAHVEIRENGKLINPEKFL